MNMTQIFSLSIVKRSWIASLGLLLLALNADAQSWSQVATNANVTVCSGGETGTMKFTSQTLNPSLCPQAFSITHTWYTAQTGGSVVASQSEVQMCSSPSGLVVTHVIVSAAVTYWVMPFYNGSAMLANRVAVNATFTSGSPSLSANYTQGQQVCAGLLVLTASGGTVSGWFKDGLQITGATGSTYAPTANGSYKALVSSPSCGSVYTGAYSANILQPTVPTLSISNSPSGTTFCQGTSVTFTASSNVTGTFSWNTGETTASITKTINGAATYSVTMTVTQACVTTTSLSSNTSVNIYSLPTALGSVADQSYCSTTGGASITVSLASASWIYRLWQGGTSLAVAPAPDVNGLATFPGTYPAGTYTVTTENPSCPSIRTTVDNSVVVTMINGPVFSANYPENQQVCSGLLVLTATGGTISGWFKDGNQISGATGSTYAPSASGSYKALVNIPTCGSIYTGSYSANILQPTVPTLSISNNPSGTTFCQGTSVTFTASSNVTGTFSWNTGETTASITKTINTAATYSVTMAVTQSCVTTTSKNSSVSVDIYTLPVANGNVPDQNYCSTSSGASIAVYNASSSWAYRLWQGSTSLAVVPPPNGGSITFPGTYTPGTYSVTTENPTCPSVRTTVDNSVLVTMTQQQTLSPGINVVSPAEVTFDTGTLYHFCHDSQIRVDLINGGGGSVQWSGIAGSVDGSNPNTFYPTINEGATATFGATVTPIFCTTVTQPANVTITRQTATPLPTVALLSFLPNCARTDIVMTQPLGISLFWQHSNDLSLKDTNYIPGGGSDKTMLSFTTPQTLYLRSRQGQCWSDAILPVDVSIQSNPTTSITPIKTSACNGETGSVQANVSAGASFTWLDSQHRFLSNQTTYTTGPLYQNLTVQLEAKTPIGCVTTQSVTFTVITESEQPQEPVVTKLTNTSYSLALSNPNSGYTYYWQTTPDGTVTTDVVNPKIVSTPGIYLLKPKNNSTGCWGVIYGTEVVDVQPHTRTLGSLNLTRSFTYQIDQNPDVNNPNHVMIENNFFDGEGRGIQKVSKQASPNQLDLVVPMDYDDLGRMPRGYLPYQSSEQTGSLKTTPYTDQSNFYNASGTKHAQSAYGFSFQVLERSKPGRALSAAGTGESWTGVAGTVSAKDVKSKLVVQQSNEVILFTYDPTTGQVSTGAGQQPAYYAAGQLISKVNTDEQGNDVVEYADKLGHTVCKKVQYGSDVNGKLYASTYYIYDDLGNLVVVLPPEGVKALVPGSN